MLILSTMFLFGHILTGCAAEQPQNDFIFKLYRAAATDEANENVAVSPLSVQQVLEFVRSGAAGETWAEIDRLLAGTKPVKWNGLLIILSDYYCSTTV